MFEKITCYAKKNPATSLFCAIAAGLFVIFTILFSFYILQSDDFYYASFWRKGIMEFIRLTVDHFQSFNGRAIVHFAAQTNLSLPRFAGSFINSCILFFIGFLSFKFSFDKNDIKSLSVFTVLFYSLICFLGLNTTKEALMWVSAFYNYVFPCLLAFLALYFTKKQSNLAYILSFIAGATTEQWGAAIIVMLFIECFSNHPVKVSFRNLFNCYLPTICGISGYITIYLSPATRLRLTTTGHATVSGSLIDLPRLGKIFFSLGSPVILFIIFTVLTIITAFLFKKSFSVLYVGFLPLALISTSTIHQSYLATLIIFVCYLLVCIGVFMYEKHFKTAIFISGALVSTLIMMPTNTFDARITFPCTILVVIASVNILFMLFKKLSDTFLVPFVCILTLMALVFFLPLFKGFMHNSIVEHENLSAIKSAQKTGELHYCIDYDLSFTTKQMFTDGWFYNQFLSLYSLEDCKVFIESKNSVSLDKIKTKGLYHNEDVYVPMRAFIQEMGGTLSTENGILMTIGDKTLTLTNGMLTYTDHKGAIHYLVADHNKILNFYTLYLRLSVVNDAFHLNIKAL